MPQQLLSDAFKAIEKQDPERIARVIYSAEYSVRVDPLKGTGTYLMRRYIHSIPRGPEALK